MKLFTFRKRVLSHEISLGMTGLKPPSEAAVRVSFSKIFSASFISSISNINPDFTVSILTILIFLVQ